MNETKLRERGKLADDFLNQFDANGSNSSVTYDVNSTIHVDDAEFNSTPYSVPAGSREYTGKTVETNSGRKKAKDLWDMIPSGRI